MLKKWIGATLLVLLCFALGTAVAWAPDRFYESITDLPQEVQNALPEHAKYVTGLNNGDTVMVTILTSETTKKIGIFRESNSHWRLLCWSAPLSANVSMGSGSQYCLYLYVNEYCYTFQETEDGAWRLMYFQGKENVLFIPDGCRLAEEPWQYHYGTVTWPSLDSLNTDSLPTSYTQACAMVDSKNWAVVHNPNPEDRLHLRTAADKNAASLGKYYNGTPVQVLKRYGDWTQVNILGVRGYMMSAYLDTGTDKDFVAPAFAALSLSDDALRRGIEVYDAPSEEATVTGKLTAFNGVFSQMYIVGVVGDGWLHIFTISGLHGYARSIFFTPGNG